MSSSSNTGILNLHPRQESKIILRASHPFGNFTSRINSSDKIWFKGTLKTLFTSKSDDLLNCKFHQFTRIELNSLGCHHCTEKSLSSVSIATNFNVDNYLKDFQRGIKYLLNVLFNPLVRFK